MTGEGANVNNDSGTLDFHGFNSREMNIAGYLTPMFNKTGVATEDDRMIRGILQKYNTMVANAQEGGGDR